MDRLARLQPHHGFGTLGVVAQVASPQEPAQPHEGHQQHHHDRRQVDDELVEPEARAAADDDVGRVADQRGRAADVAGHHLGQEERHRVEREPLAQQERHRGDQEHGRDVVEQGGGDGGDDDEEHHHPERSRLRPLRRPDGQELEDARLPEDADDHHHPEEQEDDVPVDPGLFGEEDLVTADRSDADHRGRTEQRDDGAVELLGDDDDVRRGEDEQRQHSGQGHGCLSASARRTADQTSRHTWETPYTWGTVAPQPRSSVGRSTSRSNRLRTSGLS